MTPSWEASVGLDALHHSHISATWTFTANSPPCSFSADATKITLAPSSADINVGENLTLQCHASHDPTMDLTFTWSLDDFPIDFDKLEGHYQRASVVSRKGIKKGWKLKTASLFALECWIVIRHVLMLSPLSFLFLT